MTSRTWSAAFCRSFPTPRTWHRRPTSRRLGLDSLNAVHLLSVLENAYRVRFDDSALSMETFRTAGMLWSTVERTLDHAAR
ncbi:phosphopantetheine-binding protein [Lentzea chajnantorensis]